MSRKLYANEQGVTHLLFIILALIILGAVGYAGWKVVNNKSSSNGSSSGTQASANTAAVNSVCMATYHDANLCHFAANSTTLDKAAYEATLAITSSDNKSTMTLSNDGKGNTSLIGTGNGATFNSVQLSGASYIESGTSGWIEYPASTTAPAQTSPTSSMDIGVGAAGITYKNLGTAPCGALTCYKYQVSAAATPSTTQYVWFDNSGYKLREWQASDPTSGTTDMTISYQPVTITAPSPIIQVISANGQ